VKPLIGLTWGEAGEVRRDGMNKSYVRALQAAGASVVIVPPGTEPELLERLHGILVPGGADVAPQLYGREPDPMLGSVDRECDEFELGFVRRSAERRLPVLGICRGHQVINVALGGSLVQHVEGHSWNGRPRDRATHAIRVEEGTHLARIVGAASVMVNSGHHQVVDRVAAGLNVSAVSEEGYVEGLESADGSVLTLQCHPEELLAHEWARRLFADFVERAGPV